MDHPNTPPPTHTNSSNSSITTSSPAMSFFSRGHASKSSQSSSSIASSPTTRDSFDLYVSSRLDQVAEEPQEKDDIAWTSLIDHTTSTDIAYNQYFTSDDCSATFPYAQHPGTEHQNHQNTTFRHQNNIRHGSLDRASTSVGNRLSNRFESISRKWKNRTGAGPQLSIITHVSAPTSRNGSANSSQIMSPALSAISRHESYIPSSPANESFDDSIQSSNVLSIPEKTEELEEERSQATTPLLPPVFNELSSQQYPFVTSPLQSPSVAPVTDAAIARDSMDASPTIGQPSSPLSARPSVRSIQQRSRSNTATAGPLAEVPAFLLANPANDRWAAKLGHADFNIHPEPYFPQALTLDSYTEFRQNWDQARTRYAKHIARTIENYGSTSKVFILTEEKWNSIDQVWKRYYDDLTNEVAPILHQPLCDCAKRDSNSPPLPLEKPVTKIQIPIVDVNSGKFPQIGDGEIIGPMSVAPPRLRPSETSRQPSSPIKRNFLRFFSDMFNRT